MEQQPAPRHDFFQLLAAEAEGPVGFTLLAAGRDAARGFGGRRLRDGRVRGPGVVLSLGCEKSRVDGVGVAATGQYTNLPILGHPRGLIRVNRHAARVATTPFDVVRVAAKRVKIWIRRQEHLGFEDELTGVGVSGRAAPLVRADMRDQLHSRRPRHQTRYPPQRGSLVLQCP